MKRKKIKTILCNLAIITICAGVFCHGYINGISISEYDRLYSYAEADNWSSCDTSDLVTAFRYYCKSRNLAIEGSVADALTSFTTTTFNNICSTLGIDPTELQAELKKTTDGNLGLRFLFSNTGITAYNRIFAEFLQNNNLAVGDSVDNEVIKSGKWLQITENAGCYLFILSSTNDQKYTKNQIVTYGSPFIRQSWLGTADVNWNGTFGTKTYHFYVKKSTNSSYPKNVNFQVYTPDWGTALLTTLYDTNYGGSPTKFDAYIGYCLVQSDNSIRCLTYDNMSWNSSYTSNLNITSPLCYLRDMQNPPEDTDITINTPNNTVINNNEYNNNYVIIYNEGDTYVSDNDDEPGPETPPGGGGGGGDDPGGDPDNWNPTQPSIPTPTNPNFPTVELPDIDIPDLPSLNFSLGDLRNKFPFSLPFDIIAVLNVLDGEPQAPHIEATVPIGKWYTWEMDFDFAEFDNYARIFRAFEFIGFCIGLAIFTVHFVKG